MCFLSIEWCGCKSNDLTDDIHRQIIYQDNGHMWSTYSMARVENNYWTIHKLLQLLLYEYSSYNLQNLRMRNEKCFSKNKLRLIKSSRINMSNFKTFSRPWKNKIKNKKFKTQLQEPCISRRFSSKINFQCFLESRQECTLRGCGIW